MAEGPRRPPLADDPAVSRHISKILTDTGYCCRNLLGWNYDEDENQDRLNEGSGGIRPYGKHQEMVDLLDDPTTKFKHLQSPRGSYKSTVLQGFCARNILATPDIRIMYFARTDALALEKSLALRAAMETQAVTELFGEQKLPGSWEQTRWTVRHRVQRHLQNATFSAWSQDSMPTGGRGNIVLVDDWIDHKDLHTSDANEKSKKVFRYLSPFVAKGGMFIVVGTRYGEDDVYYDLEENPLFHPPTGRTLIIGAGVKVIKDAKGKLDLEEEPEGISFPHQDIEFLRRKLLSMSAEGNFFEFSCQYLNYVPSGAGSIFRRWMFKDVRFGPDMEQLSGFLLTDTATSQEDEGCHSVVAYIGLDAVDNYYLLDLRVGHWTPDEFVGQFFDVLETWQKRVNHVAEVWEDISLSTVFNYAIQHDSRSRKIRTRSISIKRYSSKAKNARIQRMHSPMSQGKFYVADTVPSTYDDSTGTHPLWNPEGFTDSRSKTKQPSGELVNQFIRLGSYGKKDIADALAMGLEYEKKRGGNLKRYCEYRPYRGRRKPVGLTDQRSRAYHQAEYGQSQADWWDQVTKDLYGN